MKYNLLKNTVKDDMHKVLHLFCYFRNVIERDSSLQAALDQHKKDLPETYAATLQKFDKELVQKTRQTNDSRQNASFFAGALFAILAVVVRTYNFGLSTFLTICFFIYKFIFCIYFILFI
jgi:hypothetical protein